MTSNHQNSDAVTPLAIDGSLLEGGGQILRNAMAYSALLQKPITVSRIRANRTQPGLRPQHATGLQLVSILSEGGELTGVATGSNEITFHPGRVLAGHHEADTRTAGSIALLIQVALPCLLFAHGGGESELVLKGGTNANMAPQVDYTEHVLLPFLKSHLGLDLGLTIVKRGFYPKGGGEVHLRIPVLKEPLPAFELLERGDVKSIRGMVVTTSAVPQRALNEMAASTRRYLKAAGFNARQVDIDEVREPPQRGPGNGSMVFLWAETEGGCRLSGGALSSKGMTNDAVAKEAVDELVGNLASGAPVDEWMQDQMIIFMALAKGTSRVLTPKMSLHTETAIMIAEQLTDATFSTTDHAPDMSSLAIGDQDQEYDFNDMQQQHKTFHYAQSPANNPLSAQFQFAPASLGQQAMKKPARAALPSQWRDNPEEPAHAPVTPDGNVNRALSPPHTSDFSSSGGSPPPPSVPQIQPPQLYGIAQQGGGGGYSTVPHIPAPSSHHSDDDIIPNAIVIKNIPFTVKRETLLDIIASLNIPTPYAFNYHIDSNGQFRGLAFANFRVAGDADAVVAALNGFDVQGRKLRVEYKKVLLAGEKERIEREKAMRRMRSMQLEKERERNGEWDAFPTSVNNMPGLGSPGSGGGGEMSPNPMMPGMPSPSPNRFSPNVGMGAMFSPSIPQPYPSPPPPIAPSMKAISAQNELDLNDAATLEIYSRILVFKEDRMRDELAFSRTLTPRQRRIVHLAAQRLGVYHYSVGEGEERYAVVTRIPRDGDAAPRQPVRHASQTFLRSSSNNYGQSPTTPSRNNLAAPNEGLGFFKKQSMPNLKSAYGTEPGGRSLQNRPSNSNLSAYKTLTGYEPRRNKEFGALFGGSDIPPVPTLPTIPSMEGGGANGNGVVRQPRGPGNGGFARRPAEIRSTSNSGLDARTHEPLEI